MHLPRVVNIDTVNHQEMFEENGTRQYSSRTVNKISIEKLLLCCMEKLHTVAELELHIM